MTPRSAGRVVLRDRVRQAATGLLWVVQPRTRLEKTSARETILSADANDTAAPIDPGRRGFLRGAALGGVAAVAAPSAAMAQANPPA